MFPDMVNNVPDQEKEVEKYKLIGLCFMPVFRSSKFEFLFYKRRIMMTRKLMYVAMLVILVVSLVGCAAKTTTSAKIKIGLSFSDFATERWPIENAMMTKLLQAKGYEVISQEADHDVKLQSDQIDNMVSQGIKGLIVIAEDGDAAVTPVEKAVAAGVKVIAYDRLIKTSKISAYLSFDNVEVGRQEALGVLTALGLPGSTTWTKDNPVKMVLSGGAPTDNNAHLVRQGQMEKIQPFIDQGVVKVVADQWVENWDAAKAEAMMENILTAQQNKIDAVVASNDGTALGELQAMKAQALAGKVPISGQDATADGCNSIVLGQQTVTVYKDTRLLSPKAVDMIDALIKGQTPAGLQSFSLATLTGNKDAKGDVQANFLPVVQVTKANVYDLIVKSGFQSYDQVYRNVPADQLPPKP
jgi:D-xylose transport system substrate-binding protein